MPPACVRQGQCASVNSKQPFADGVGLVPCFLLLFFSDCAFTRPHFNLSILLATYPQAQHLAGNNQLIFKLPNYLFFIKAF